MNIRMILAAIAMLGLVGCTAAGEAAEAAVEVKVDEFIDKTIDRICKGPIDIAVRTAQRYPALMTAAFEVCPDTYGAIYNAVLAGVARDDAVMRAVREMLSGRE